MKPKFVGGKHKKQTEMEPVYDQTVDLQATIHQIVSDLKEQQNQDMRKVYALPWKEVEYASVKFGGNKLELIVNILDGSLREPKRNPAELQARLKDVYDILHRFEDAVRKEFRKRTGKALTWVDPKEFGDCELIALNGLHRYFAIKLGEVKTKLVGQAEYE
jgi:hypothetical protein